MEDGPGGSPAETQSGTSEINGLRSYAGFHDEVRQIKRFVASDRRCSTLTPSQTEHYIPSHVVSRQQNLAELIAQVEDH